MKRLTNLNRQNSRKHLGNFISRFNVFYLTILVARNYLNNFTLWLTNFGVPILVFFIVNGVLGQRAVGLAIGVAASGSVSIGVLSLAVSLTEWKSSVIYKKIKVSLFSSFQFFSIFFIFYFFISFLSFWVTIAAASIIDPNVGSQIQKIDKWGYFFLSLFLLVCICVLIGVTISLVTKSVVAAQGLGFGIYIITSFLTSSFLPLTTSMANKFLWIGGWWTPTYSPIQNLYAVFFDNLVKTDYLADIASTGSDNSLFEFDSMKIQIPSSTTASANSISFTEKPIGLFRDYWLNVAFSGAWIATLFSTCFVLLKTTKLN